jgi:uncharacterized protein (TIGR02996 family)
VADPRPHLDRALRGDAGEALGALVEAWRVTPADAIADVIDVVGVAGSRAHVEAKTLDDRQQQWLAVAAARDPRDLQWLVAHTPCVRGELTLERLRELAAWPKDPRLAARLVAVAAQKPLTSRQNRPVWTALFRILHRRLDYRLAARVAELVAAPQLTEFDDYLAAKLTTLGRRLERPPINPPWLSPDAVEMLAALRAKYETPVDHAAQKTDADFTSQIWAAPGDTGLREVYADWLIERDDPRGELIMLQIARTRRAAEPAALRREQALLRAHARTWMGPLEPVVGKKFRFERGFLYACDVAWRKLATQPALMKHPAWGTVREYTLPWEGEGVCDPWLDHMIALGAKRV